METTIITPTVDISLDHLTQAQVLIRRNYLDAIQTNDTDAIAFYELVHNRINDRVKAAQQNIDYLDVDAEVEDVIASVVFTD